MIVSLLVTKGEDYDKVFRLEDDETKIIGRSSQADIVLNDTRVSRQHCRVRAANGVCTLVDLNSKNGTALNGQRLRGEVQLNDGDVIELAATCLSIRISTGTAEKGKSREPAAPEADKKQAAIGPVSSPPAEEAPPHPVVPSGESLMGAFERYLEEPHSAERTTVSKAPQISIGPVPESQRAPSADDMIGKLVGGCRVEELLGEDMLCRVYRATQISMERTVALKILSPQVTDDSRTVERFICAARAGGSLNHPHIVQVYDAGKENDAYFVALELVDGKSLRTLLEERGRNRPLPLSRALDIAEHIADALQYAHEQSVIHRDITPDNIHVTHQGMAKLADLGFSKSLHDSGIQRPTRPGEPLGKLYFTAPEQLADVRSATARSDIYSLGAVLFVMLTGHMPFGGKSEQEILEQVRCGRHESVRRLQGEVPEELAQVVDRAMARSPEERYATAAEFRGDIRRVRAALKL